MRQPKCEQTNGLITFSERKYNGRAVKSEYYRIWKILSGFSSSSSTLKKTDWSGKKLRRLLTKNIVNINRRPTTDIRLVADDRSSSFLSAFRLLPQSINVDWHAAGCINFYFIRFFTPYKFVIDSKHWRKHHTATRLAVGAFNEICSCQFFFRCFCWCEHIYPRSTEKNKTKDKPRYRERALLMLCNVQCVLIGTARNHSENEEKN